MSIPNLLSVLMCCALMFGLSVDSANAQRRKPNSQRNVLPRVGTIKDYPATGLMTGCANLYVYPASRVSSSSEAYLFLSRGDGSNAWMNLNGRDVRLWQIKSSGAENRQPARYSYRLGTLRITVVIEKLNPESELARQDFMFTMKITLRRGRAVRVVRGVGSSDC